MRTNLKKALVRFHSYLFGDVAELAKPPNDSGQLVCKIGRAAGDIDPRHATLSPDLLNMKEVAWSTFYAFLGSRSGANSRV